MNSKVRIQKFLSECGVSSRREAERMILDGRVRLNGQLVTQLGTQMDPYNDVIKVGNKVVRPAHKGIILFHKPRGVLSTMKDEHGRETVADFLTPRYRSYYPVGRLDWDATGLLILTNDGELANRLMHPKFGFKRTYHVRVEGIPGPLKFEKLLKGVTLEDGKGYANRVEILRVTEDTCWIEIEVSEGRNHLVKRLFDKIEHPVIKLKRVGHGPFKLGSLPPGELQKVPENDYSIIRKKVFEGSEALAKSMKASPEDREFDYSKPEKPSGRSDKRGSRRGRPERGDSTRSSSETRSPSRRNSNERGSDRDNSKSRGPSGVKSPRRPSRTRK